VAAGLNPAMAATFNWYLQFSYDCRSIRLPWADSIPSVLSVASKLVSLYDTKPISTSSISKNMHVPVVEFEDAIYLKMRFLT
jgi:hypothetical protein